MKTRDLFNSGEYQKITDAYGANPAGIANADAHYLISALYFLGRITEAETLMRARSEQLLLGQRAFATFFKLIALTRVSRYGEAEKCLSELKNFKSSRSSRATNEAAFFYFQGEGFFRYYKGDYMASAQFAAEALAVAPKLKTAYFLALAKDLLGHVLVQRGSLHAGLKHVSEAADIFAKSGHVALQNATRAAHLCYRAQFGLEPGLVVDGLTKWLRQTRFQDSYSQANLGLELARQLILRGRYEEAGGELERIAPLIYAQENRRQEILLNLRLAEMYLHLRDLFQAQHFTRSARRCLSFEVDSLFELRVLGIERKLAIALKQSTDAIEFRQRSLSANFNFTWNEQIRARSSGAPLCAAGEDVLGSFLDDLKNLEVERKTREINQKIIESGYWGLLTQHNNWPIRGAIILDLVPGRLTLFSREGISHGSKVVSKQIRKLIVALQKAKTKEQLVTEVWGYKYHPLRHDPMIYAAIAQLRKTLGRFDNFLVTTEDGYRLNTLVEFSNVDEAPLALVSREFLDHADVPDVNHRQLQILERLKKVRSLDVRACQKTFKTSLITASRDLSQLFEMGLVRRIGKGRATVYVQAAVSR